VNGIAGNQPKPGWGLRVSRPEDDVLEPTALKRAVSPVGLVGKKGLNLGVEHVDVLLGPPQLQVDAPGNYHPTSMEETGG